MVRYSLSIVQKTPTTVVDCISYSLYTIGVRKVTPAFLFRNALFINELCDSFRKYSSNRQLSRFAFSASSV